MLDEKIKNKTLGELSNEVMKRFKK